MEQKQWDNTPPARMVDGETHVYECRNGGKHLHRICCSDKLAEKKRICKYCKCVMAEIVFEIKPEGEKTND